MGWEAIRRSARNISVLAGHELRLLKTDFFLLLIMTCFPLVTTSLFTPMMASLVPDLDGARQMVPGAAVLFSFLMVAIASSSFWRDHLSLTWDRLRASPLYPMEIIGGKILSLMVLGLGHFALLFAVGVVLFGLRIDGPILALLPIVVSLLLCLLAIASALVAVCRTAQQINAAAFSVMILLGNSGGTVIPFEVLPDWVRALGSATPSYWAMRGFFAVIDGENVATSVLLASGLLLGFAALCLVIALRRFDFEEQKLP